MRLSQKDIFAAVSFIETALCWCAWGWEWHEVSHERSESRPSNFARYCRSL